MTEQVGAPPPEIVIDEGLSLKPVALEDSEEMFALINADRAHLSRFGDDTASKYPTLESMRERNSTQSPNEKRFGIRDHGKLVGFIKVTYRGEPGWEVGYWLGAEHTGHGYMTRAVTALTNYAFTNLGAKRVFATVHADNGASNGVLIRTGFHLEGPNPDKPTDVIFARNKPQVTVTQP